jgi:hypothetical protein
VLEERQEESHREVVWCRDRESIETDREWYREKEHGESGIERERDRGL